jgi:hypothetical protein
MWEGGVDGGSCTGQELIDVCSKELGEVRDVAGTVELLLLTLLVKEGITSVLVLVLVRLYAREYGPGVLCSPDAVSLPRRHGGVVGLVLDADLNLAAWCWMKDSNFAFSVADKVRLWVFALRQVDQQPLRM